MLTGWFAGVIFFAISYSWFTYTVGGYVGSLAFGIVVIPAGVHALSFAASAVMFKIAVRYAPQFLAPVAGAAAFTVCEWLKSIGIVGIPFAQIGYTQTGSPLGLFAAYIGCYGVTFVVMLIGASIAQAITRRRAGALAAVVGVLTAAWVVCYAVWPARHPTHPAMRVAAIQGNVPQSLKATSVQLSVDRYVDLTKRAAPLHAQLIVWPETVILTELNFTTAYWDMRALAPEQRSDLEQRQRLGAQLHRQFSQLARSLQTEIVVGSQDLHLGSEGLKEYNALFTFASDGTLINVYDKRQLVPFAESLPAPAIMSWLPYASLIGRFGHGHLDAVVPAGRMKFAPLICWESAFADLVHEQIQNGAQFLVIPTDDAWFGPSSGTYQHAQIAQMRAIESGEWVIQAASTGISGIIAPDGTWIEHTALDRQAIVAGTIGFPPGSLFARIGPNPVMYALVAIYMLIVGLGAVRYHTTTRALSHDDKN